MKAAKVVPAPVPVPHVCGEVLSDQFWDRGKRLWKATLIYVCPFCKQRHTSPEGGSGVLPSVFPTTCIRGNGELEIVPLVPLCDAEKTAS